MNLAKKLLPSFNFNFWRTSSHAFVRADRTMGTVLSKIGTLSSFVMLCFIDPRVQKIRNDAFSCLGIFSSTLSLWPFQRLHLTCKFALNNEYLCQYFVSANSFGWHYHNFWRSSCNLSFLFIRSKHTFCRSLFVQNKLLGSNVWFRLVQEHSQIKNKCTNLKASIFYILYSIYYILYFLISFLSLAADSPRTEKLHPDYPRTNRLPEF